MKSRSGDAAGNCPPSNWTFYQQLMFLKDIVTPRVSSGSLKSLTVTEIDQTEPEQAHVTDNENEPSLQEDSQSEVQDESHSHSLEMDCMDDIVSNDGESTSATSTAIGESTFTTPSAQKRKRKAIDYNSKLLELEEKKIQYLLNKPRRDEEDSDLLFYKALLPHVRLIPKEKKIQFQGEIQAVVQRYAYPPSRAADERMHMYYTSSSPSPSNSEYHEYETARRMTDTTVYHAPY